MLTQYLISYDIVNNKTRNKILEQLKNFGLKPVQKSVLWGELNNAELNSIKRLFLQLGKCDKAIITTCPASRLMKFNYNESEFKIIEYASI